MEIKVMNQLTLTERLFGVIHVGQMVVFRVMAHEKMKEGSHEPRNEGGL